MRPPAIEIENLWFQYTSGADVLRDVSLTVYQAERVALLGHNGSGKSTLVKHLNGLLRPRQGNVKLFSTSAADKRVAELAATVALLFQNPDDQICKGTVWDEAAFGPRNLGYPEERVRTLVDTSLEIFDLLPMVKHNPQDLGLSERKRLAMASVLAMDTEIVVLDEPTAGLDPGELLLLENALHRLESENKTVLVISHDMDFIVENMTRAVCLQNGVIQFDGSLKELFEHPAILAQCGLIPPQIAQLSTSFDLELQTFTPEGFIEALLTAKR